MSKLFSEYLGVVLVAYPEMSYEEAYRYVVDKLLIKPTQEYL